TLQLLVDRLGRRAALEMLEDPGAEPRVGAVLRQDRADTRFGPGAAAADGDGGGGDDGAEHSRAGAASGDREGHVSRYTLGRLRCAATAGSAGAGARLRRSRGTRCGCGRSRGWRRTGSRRPAAGRGTAARRLRTSP